MARCPQCGQENPDLARFCLACGAPLEGSGAPRGEERKLVTVCFLEATFPAATDASPSDPERLKRSLDPFHALVAREVANYGGTVDKVMGASVLAVFGAPVAHEDDPIRALRVALNVRDAVAEAAEAGPGSRIGVRIGVNTGEAVVASPGTGPQVGEAVAGDVVNTAARLQQAAASGEILVGEETAGAATYGFELQELEPVVVKGKAEPVPVWRAIAARSRFGVDLRPRPSTPFVGRVGELAMVEGAFRRTIAERSVQLVTITGEPGVGKTRLVEELGRVAEEWPQLIRWRQGRCLPYGEGVGYWALGEIVKAEANILDSDPPDVVDTKLTAAVERNIAEPTEREWVRARLEPLTGLGGVPMEAAREELFTAWRRFLEAMATRTPAVFVFEDLQWADEGMLGFVSHVVDWTVGLPMLVVCTARPELYAKHPTWAGGRRNATSIALSPLSDQETAMLLTALLEGDVLPAQVQAALLERSGGNPLYAEEFARMLRDEGLVGPAGAGEGLDPAAMPRTLQLLIGARLDTLGYAEKATLQDAAVVGKLFWAGALSSMSGAGQEEVVRRLHEAVHREFVRPVREPSVAGQSEYAFLHALVQEVAYGQIPRAARAAKHLKAAAWLREVAGERVVDMAEVLAHNYAEALELARSTRTGLDEGELVEVAGEAFLLAGDRAKRLDPARAIPFFQRARDVLGPDDPERTRALVEAAEAEEEIGRFEEAARHFALAIEEAAARGDELGRGEAMARMARSVLIHGPTARELLEDAIRILETQEPGPELVRAYTRMAGHLYVAGENIAAVPWAEKALALADELGMEGESVLALGYRGAARAQVGEREGIDDLREALRQALDLGLGAETAIAYNNLAYQLWLWYGPAAAKEVWDEMAAFCRVRGFHTMAMWARGGTLESMFDLGEWDRILQISAEMLAWDREHGPTRVSVTALTFEAWVRLRRGELDRTAELCERLLPLAREIGYPEFLAPALVIASELALLRGDRVGARAFLREFEDVTREQEDYRTMMLPVVVRLLRDAGDVTAAEDLIMTAVTPTLRHRVSVLTAEALVAEARGRFEDALAMYREADSGWSEYRFGLERARLKIAAGRCLLALGRPDEAEREARDARELLEPLGARLFIEEADELLARATPSS